MVNASEALSIYLHIPFCKTMCTYCAFNTYTGKDDLFDAFVDALATEIRYVGARNPGLPVHTIFFGGGTPSLLTPEHYQTLFSALGESFRIVNDAEISLESNPNDLDYAYLKNLNDIGFNRLSIGMQSSNPYELNLYRREHDHKMVIQAVENAHQSGWTNISLDLMYGAPEQTLTQWEKTLSDAIALDIDHISAYGLTLEGNTPLKDWVDEGKVPEPDDDRTADMYELATTMLQENGFEQYEISNWAKPTYESEHNLQYWRNLEYIGLGPGAHGHAANTRTIVMRFPEKYINALSDDLTDHPFPQTPAISKAVPTDEDTEMSDTIMMGLRLTQEGIQRTTFEKRFGIDIAELKHDAIEKYQKLGMIHLDDTTLRLTQRARLISNAVIQAFI